jgi:hypothetical protein
MINNLPLRLTILHFAQRLRMEGLTFMIAFSLQLLVQPNSLLYLVYSRPSSLSATLTSHGRVKTRGSPSVIATECS